MLNFYYGGFSLRNMGFLFVLAGLTKIWLSIYLSDFYLLKKLQVSGSAEGDAFEVIPDLAWKVIIVEFIIGIILIVVDRKKKIEKWYKNPSFPLRNDGFSLTLREMTIPRNVDDGAEPSTKKTVGIDRFHNLFYLKNKHLLLTFFFGFDIYKL